MKRHPFSQRSEVAAKSPWANAVSGARKRSGLLDLTSGNPTLQDGLAITEDEGALLRAALSAPAVARYSPSSLGSIEARAAIAERFSASPERVVLTASTSEAYAHLFALLAESGDAVLAPTPSYPLLPHLAAARDVRIESYALQYDGAWYIDAAGFRASVEAHKPKAIVTVNPNNPTGSWLDAEGAALIAETGVPHIVDEVFAGYPITPPAARTEGPAVSTLEVRLGGLSKYAGLPQVKLAWMLLSGDDDVVSEATRRLEMSLDAFLSISASAQANVPALLQLADVRRSRIQSATRARLEQLRAAFEGTAVTLLEPRAGWYAILRLPAVREEDELARAILDAGVLVQPGWLYDLELPGPAVVVSLLTPPAVMRDATARILELVDLVSR